MSVTALLIGPFAEFAFMQRSLVALVLLAVSGAPLGVFMSLRRMTLAGDALAHALLPGVAISFLVAGLSLWAMTLGGLVASFIVAGLVTLLTRYTRLKEDAAFSLVYLVSLALGVVLVSLYGGSVNLVHLLFGNVLGIDAPTLWLLCGATCFTLFIFAAGYRRFVIEGFDPAFLRVAASARWAVGSQGLFFIVLMLNLVVAFQALGTLMALGLMILPSLAARFWTRQIDCLIPLAMGLAVVSAVTGLLISFHASVPTGPAVVLVAGGIALVSALIGRSGSVLRG